MTDENEQSIQSRGSLSATRGRQLGPSRILSLARDAVLIDRRTRKPCVIDDISDELVMLVDYDLTNGTQKSMDFAGRFGLQCRWCGGCGSVDSGAAAPSGEWISVCCPECNGGGVS